MSATSCPRLDPNFLPLAAAIAAPLIWSVGGVVMRSVDSAGPWEQVFWRALLGAFQIGIGLSLFLFALRHLPAAPVALLTLLEPMVGPLLVWLFVGEVPPVVTLIGGTIVIAALVICAQAAAGRRLPPLRQVAS